MTIRSVITRDVNSTRYLYDEEDAVSRLSNEELVFHNNLKVILEEELKRYEPAINLLEFNYSTKDDLILVVAKIRTPLLLGPAQVRKVETGLQNKIDPQIKLIVRSVLGADATSEYYLGEYEDALLDTVAK